MSGDSHDKCSEITLKPINTIPIMRASDRGASAQNYALTIIHPEWLMSTIVRPPVYRVLKWQLIALGLSSIFLLPFGSMVSFSVLIGGMIHIIPHAWFAKIAFSKVGTRQLSAVVANFYLGQAAKFILTAFLMWLAFRAAAGIDVLLVVCGFIAMVPLYLIFVTKALRQLSA